MAHGFDSVPSHDLEDADRIRRQAALVHALDDLSPEDLTETVYYLNMDLHLKLLRALAGSAKGGSR